MQNQEDCWIRVYDMNLNKAYPSLGSFIQKNVHSFAISSVHYIHAKIN